MNNIVEPTKESKVKTVSLNIVMTYPVHWSKYQVLRDFAQNFYDAVGHDHWNQRFHYDYCDSSLSMWIENVTFSYEWLMFIGASTKTGKSEEYAGFFGEGFKIASLCGMRDWGWEIQMMSGDWTLEVTEIGQTIDQIPVKMLAYNISSRLDCKETRLVLKNVSASDYRTFLKVLDSFFSLDNPIMGEKVWMGKEGAVFLRSRNQINPDLPVTYGFGRKGAVFCGYQMLGTNPFNLVVCLHDYKKGDRERRDLYSFEVIRVFEYICEYIDASCSMVMLVSMRRYWNSYPKKGRDIESWSPVIDLLILNISRSPKIRNYFMSQYKELVCLKKVYSVGEKNIRWQAKAWLRHQDKKYILAKDTFLNLGYPSLETECKKNGGLVSDGYVDSLQNACFIVLEDVCKNIFDGFFETTTLPDRRIITSLHAAYHGMAVTCKKKETGLNNKGITIRREIIQLYLKSNIFRSEGYFDALSTYVHEMCHIFGGDASASFSKALTLATELLLENHDKVMEGKDRWDQVFVKYTD